MDDQTLVVIVILAFGLASIVAVRTSVTRPRIATHEILRVVAVLSAIGACMYGVYLLSSDRQAVPGSVLVASGVIGLSILASGKTSPLHEQNEMRP